MIMGEDDESKLISHQKAHRIARLKHTGRQVDGLVDELDTRYAEDLNSLVDMASLDYYETKNYQFDKNTSYSGIEVTPLSMRDEINRGEIDDYGVINQRLYKNDCISSNGFLASNSRHSRRPKIETGESEEEIEDYSGRNSDSDDSNDELGISFNEINSRDKNSTHMDVVYKPILVSNKSTTVQFKSHLEALEIINNKVFDYETISQAIKRLSPPSLHKVGVRKEKGHAVKMQVETDMEDFDNIVNAANYFLQLGIHDIYYLKPSQLYEILNSTQNKTDQNQKLWQYKWNINAEEVYGTFKTEQMLEWKSYFQCYPDMVVREFIEGQNNTQEPENSWVLYSQIAW